MGQRAERKQRGLRAGLLIALAMVSTVACTKLKELKNMVAPEAYIGKSEVDGKLYHFVRGVEEADSHNTLDATPGFSEDFGLVKVRITETELQLLRAYDPRGRDETAQIVASYPITDQFDIKREENDYKEQTNKIVEDRERPWNQRQYIRVDWSRPLNSSSSLTNQLSRAVSRFFGNSNNAAGAGASSDLSAGMSEENTVLLETAKVENGHVSWLTETSLKEVGRNYISITPQNWEKANGYRVTFRTHLMPVKASDFKPVAYSAQDFERFGYFFTEQDFEHPEKGLLDANIKKYANVFNVCEKGREGSCSTNKIVWTLSKDFPERYLKTTRQVIKEWNETFKAALGRADDVVVLDESKQLPLSDPRVNMIGFYEPMSSGGLLGVAQSVHDPRTGETVAARATVYQDGINSTLGMVDDIIDLIVKDPSARELFVAGETVASKGAIEARGEKSTRVAKASRTLNARELRTRIEALRKTLGVDRLRSMSTVTGPTEIVKSALKRGEGTHTLGRKLEFMKEEPSAFQFAELMKLDGSLDEAAATVSPLKGLESLAAIGDQVRAEKQALLVQAEKGIHGSELVEDAALRYIQKLLEKNPSATDLAAKRAAIREEVAQLTYYTTLLHEMGHTFGLRHNFQASADEPHYTKQYFELKERLAKGDASVQEADLDPYAYSSIMDYGAEFYAQSAGLGPYDNAAIKYAYNRSIDRDSDTVTRSNFKFCTDHQVGESLLCRRFDKGRNAHEVVQFLIDSYFRDFKLAHSRNGRARFDRAIRRYAGRVLMNTFIPVRQSLDELIYNLNEAPREADAKTKCPNRFLSDSVKSGEIANVCDALVAEREGVNPADMSTFFKGLLKKGSQDEFRKDPATYAPNGFADLVLASQLAQDFFAQVLGTTEPGSYLAIPTKEDPDALTMVRLPDGDTDEAKLTAFAQKRNIEKVDEFVQNLKGFVTDVPEGRYAGHLNSLWVYEGTESKLQRIGTIWDKIMAISALGMRDYGVEKYADASLNGNAYLYPFSKGVTTMLFQRMVTMNPKISVIPVELRDGTVAPANAMAALSADIQGEAMITMLTDFVFDSDMSATDKLRICNMNEAACASNLGAEVVDYVSALGGDKFRAVQTLENDSLSYELVSEAKQVDEERQKSLEILNTWSTRQAEFVKKLGEAEAIRARIHANLAKVGQRNFQLLVTAKDERESKGRQSAWMTLVQVSAVMSKYPPANLADLAEQLKTAFAAPAVLVEQKLADVRACAPQYDPERVSRDADPDPATLGCKERVDTRPDTVAIWLALDTDLKALNALVGEYLDAGVEARTAPGDVEATTNYLKDVEARIRFIRKIFKKLAYD